MSAGRGCRIEVRAVPGSAKDALAGKVGNAFKVKVRAPAQDGRANEALIGFLAETLGLPRRSVQLLRGESSRQKLLQIDGLELGEVEARLTRA